MEDNELPIPPNTVTLVPIWARLSAASSGAFLTSFFTTPFDLIKTRLQAQHSLSSPTAAIVWQDCALRSCGLPTQSCACSLQRKLLPSFDALPKYAGTLDALLKTVRLEGVSGLWRGLNYSLAMSVPATMLYFTAYDELSWRFANSPAFSPLPPLLHPVFAGSLARIGTATFVGPLELLRTRIQSSTSLPSASLSSILSQFRAIVAADGFFGLWRGLGPTLWRDIPFSAFYWAAVERLKVPLHSHYATKNHWPITNWERFKIAFLAGAGAALLATVVTNPFDLAKTRIQVQNASSASHLKKGINTWRLLSLIVQKEGAPALMTGIVPRLMRIVPACAIMIGSYEFCKLHFVKNQTK